MGCFQTRGESEAVKNDEIQLVMIEIKTQAVGGVPGGVIPVQLLINPLNSDQDKRRDGQ